MKNRVNISQVENRHYEYSDFWNVMPCCSWYYKRSQCLHLEGQVVSEE